MRTPARCRTRAPSNSVTFAKYVAAARLALRPPPALARPADAGGLPERRASRRVDGGPVPEQLGGPFGQLARRPSRVLGDLGDRRPSLIQLNQAALDVEHLAGDVGGGVARQER